MASHWKTVSVSHITAGKALSPTALPGWHREAGALNPSCGHHCHQPGSTCPLSPLLGTAPSSNLDSKPAALLPPGDRQMELGGCRGISSLWAGCLHQGLAETPLCPLISAGACGGSTRVEPWTGAKQAGRMQFNLCAPQLVVNPPTGCWCLISAAFLPRKGISCQLRSPL